MLVDRPQLDVTTTEGRGDAEGWVVVRAAGELDLATVEVLTNHITRLAVTRRSPRVVLDLADLRFCDSSGLSALIRCHRRLRAATGALVLSGLTGQPLELLTRTGLDGLFVLAPGPDEFRPEH
ncbi:MAG TPA: STAS domain-containing protein [Thermomonospora sp.]|nr:STAS domain-containing protein [Thermomonospora sp.]